MTTYYKCNDCGQVHADYELIPVSGGDHDEVYTVCPCGADNLEEVWECSRCGGFFDRVYGEDHICESCLSDDFTVGNAIELGDENTVQVDLNEFLAYVFDEGNIRDILFDYFLNQFSRSEQRAYVEGYLEDDLSGLADIL